ncbi:MULTISPECIES: FliI/YscN family ATPase [Citricoccus]|uniref:FliI/YscN family ATPase n=1 Tax=Citricoccus TaxID=169133 RepID=UPI000255F00E|nr:FliI/YscN family ATPase [Citricoccus sp. CH26A]
MNFVAQDISAQIMMLETRALKTMTARGFDRRVAEAASLAAPVTRGSVVATQGLRAVIGGLPVAVGDVVTVGGTGGDGTRTHPGLAGVEAEVVAVHRTEATVVPLAEGWAPAAGTPVTLAHRGGEVPVGDGLIGRVVDALGRPIDGKGPIAGTRLVPAHHPAPHALDRTAVTGQLGTGLRAVDTFAALGRGHRIGLFAGPGAGTSSLLAMIARGTDAAVSVIALVGVDGHTVREFLDDLGPEGLARSVVVVATEDEPAMMRRKAAFTATRIAEQFRDQGLHALVMLDSLTRVAGAQSQIGLSAGEPPARGGHAPSTASLLAQLLERAGAGRAGSVTGIYTVLVDGEDHEDPVGEAVRPLLDGHLVLERRPVEAGHVPSIDVLASIAPCASALTGPADRAAVTVVRRAMAELRAVQDLIEAGAYVPGTRPLAEAALAARPHLDAFLRQDTDDSTSLIEAWSRLRGLAGLLSVDGAGTEGRAA